MVRNRVVVVVGGLLKRSSKSEMENDGRSLFVRKKNQMMCKNQIKVKRFKIALAASLTMFDLDTYPTSGYLNLKLSSTILIFATRRAVPNLGYVSSLLVYDRFSSI